MVGHTFSKLYATVLHSKLSSDLEQRNLRARGQVGFRPTHQTIDHIRLVLMMDPDMDSKRRPGHFDTVVSPITSLTYHHRNLATEISR